MTTSTEEPSVLFIRRRDGRMEKFYGLPTDYNGGIQTPGGVLPSKWRRAVDMEVDLYHQGIRCITQSIQNLNLL